MTRPGPARYHHGDLKRALLDAAVGLVEADGPSGLTLRAAARLAGVSQTAPYRHFADREALLAAVAEEGFALLVEWMRRAQARVRAKGPTAELGALGLTYVRFAAAHAPRFRVMLGPELADKRRHPALLRAHRAAFDLLFDAVRRCQAARAVRPGDPRALALSAWAIMHGLAALLVDGQLAAAGLGTDAAALGKRMTTALFEGLAPGAPEGSAKGDLARPGRRSRRGATPQQARTAKE